MGKIVQVEIAVEEEVASALLDPARRAQVGELLNRLIRPSDSGDPLGALLRRTRDDAVALGVTDELVDLELTNHKRERRH